jgi:hypothetical protein
MMKRLGFSFACAALSISLAACGDGGGGSTGVPDGCNPLGGVSQVACLAPFPSSVYLVADATTKTGFRLDFPDGALPQNADGIKVKPDLFAGYDGFSPNGPIIVSFATGVSEAGLTDHESIDRSVTTQSTTIILDMETGELVPHFAEIDHNSDDPLDQALIIRPMIRLKPAHRYAVAITKGVKAADGSDLPISPAFQAALDGKDYNHPLFARVKDRFPDIFAKLETAGVPKANLVLAWDYVTGSDEFLIDDLHTMQQAALTDMGDGSTLTFTGAVVQTGDPNQALRIVEGTYDAPNFMTDGESQNSILARGADGKPVLQGRFRYNFAAIIPKCLEQNPHPVPIMIFGHGLFGSGADYVDGGLLEKVANEACFIVVAGDWIGLTNRNIASTAIAINDINKGRGITEKLMQSVVNFMAMERITKTVFVNDDLFKVNGTVVIDPTQVYYFGASLGGIMGGTYMSYEPDILRGALGVPGCNWTVCFERSFAWPPLQVALKGAYPGYVKDEEVIALMGMGFDKVDPVTTAKSLTTAPITGVPAKQIFLYATLGDSLVTNISTDMMARSMGVPLLAPSVHTPFGLTTTTDPAPSGMVWFDEHPTPLPSPFNLAPSDDNGTHAGVHNRPAVRAMIERFFFQGVVENVCKVGGAPAPCDCDTGACESTFN